MSLEQSIADLTTQAGLLLDLPQSIKDEAIAQTALISQAHQDHLNSLYKSVYIDALAGDDANDGSQANPLKTMTAAIAEGARGGLLDIYLETDIHMDQVVAVSDMRVRIFSTSSQKKKLSFQQATLTTSQTYRVLRGFKISNAQILVSGLEVILPALDAVYSAYSVANAASPFHISSPTDFAVNSVVFDRCNLDIPASIFNPMINTASTGLVLMVYACVAIDQPLAGALVVGAASGTDANTIPWLLTNLATL